MQARSPRHARAPSKPQTQLNPYPDDGLELLSDEELRERVTLRLERLARYFESSRLTPEDALAPESPQSSP